jgi:hypothetical protein
MDVDRGGNGADLTREIVADGESDDILAGRELKGPRCHHAMRFDPGSEFGIWLCLEGLGKSIRLVSGLVFSPGGKFQADLLDLFRGVERNALGRYSGMARVNPTWRFCWSSCEMVEVQRTVRVTPV